VVAFIALMGFDFLHFRECKMVNLATNFGSICLFMLKGKIIWGLPYQWLLVMLLADG
jgi:hypothetical protein